MGVTLVTLVTDGARVSRLSRLSQWVDSICANRFRQWSAGAFGLWLGAHHSSGRNDQFPKSFLRCGQFDVGFGVLAFLQKLVNPVNLCIHSLITRLLVRSFGHGCELFTVEAGAFFPRCNRNLGASLHFSGIFAGYLRHTCGTSAGPGRMSNCLSGGGWHPVKTCFACRCLFQFHCL